MIVQVRVSHMRRCFLLNLAWSVVPLPFLSILWRVTWGLFWIRGDDCLVFDTYLNVFFIFAWELAMEIAQSYNTCSTDKPHIWDIPWDWESCWPKYSCDSGSLLLNKSPYLAHPQTWFFCSLAWCKPLPALPPIQTCKCVYLAGDCSRTPTRLAPNTSSHEHR